MDRCGVCFENTNHKKVTCPFCDLVTCRSCTQTYLLSVMEDAHCMGCKHVWNRQFVDNFCTYTFRHVDYRRHRENVLFEREKLQMPETQVHVEHILEMRHLNKVVAEQRVQLSKLYVRYGRLTYHEYIQIEEIRELIEQMAQTRQRIDELRFANMDVKEIKKSFVRKCPIEECKGFLDDEWYCGICRQTFCCDCCEIKDNDEHTCDPDLKKTMKLISKDTKPCPKCSTMISKIDGCAQMWCTQCQTAFDWRSGNIQIGRIHNPHYLEFKRKASTLYREHGDIPCGGLPSRHELPERLADFIHVIHWCEREIMYTEYTNTSTQHFRILYMLNDMSEKEFKRKIQAVDKHKEKNADVVNVYRMFIDTATDLLRQYVIKEDANIVKTLRELVLYSNDIVRSIHKRYKCVTPPLFNNNLLLF